MTQTQARATYAHGTEPQHTGRGAQSRQVRETWKPADVAPPAHSCSEASMPGGSRLGLWWRSAQAVAVGCFWPETAPARPCPTCSPSSCSRVDLGLEGQRRVDHLFCGGKGFSVGVGLPPLAPRGPIIQTVRWGFPTGTEAPSHSPPQKKSFCPGPPASILPENVSDTGTDPRDHIMRQTPVCPARQWELPLALTGTMTSDLKFLGRKQCIRAMTYLRKGDEPR